MAAHNILGKEGEEEAVKYLKDRNYAILSRNWRRGHKEIDIVAQKGGVLVIVEVKTRKNTLFSAPQDAVDNAKIRRIVLAADAYIKLFKIDLPVQFDIITIVGHSGSFVIEHLEEAFYPPIW